jgi:deoxyribodipyrimidine photo-lyase
MQQIRTSSNHGAEIWLAELIWRDFYFMILHHHPHVTERSFKPDYDAIQWETGEQADAHFAAWCEGNTGYPLVDAAMRQLNQTGYMHNRLRMVTACFLIKDLGIDWRRGESYFAEKLNDFDLSANNGGWQWASSSGCDAQPYFRIFNPITQSEKFDADGKFIARYLPQLARLDKRSIHAPGKRLPCYYSKRASVWGRIILIPSSNMTRRERKPLSVMLWSKRREHFQRIEVPQAATSIRWS